MIYSRVLTKEILPKKTIKSIRISRLAESLPCICSSSIESPLFILTASSNYKMCKTITLHYSSKLFYFSNSKFQIVYSFIIGFVLAESEPRDKMWRIRNPGSNTMLTSIKRYFIIDQQIARHFVQYSQCLSDLPPFPFIQLKWLPYS